MTLAMKKRVNEAFEAWRAIAAQTDILDVATRIGAKLRKRSHEWIGPCPRCGGKDRFSIRPSKQVFNCRGAGGGNVISMVMHTCAVEFLPACEIITGEPPPGADTVITDETRRKAEELKAEAAERQRRREHDDNLYRARERKTVFDIWDNAHPLQGSSAAEYLALRGLTFPATPAGRSERLKCVEAMPYHLDRDTIIHRGPAMVAPIVDSDSKFRGLHFTYLDLAQPKGKLQLQDPREPEGVMLDAKKSRGSKQGNYIALLGPTDPEQLVLGEGNEKLIAVHMALESTGRSLELTAFWSAADLGNLAGKATDTVTHPTLKNEKTGRPQKVAGAVPDLEAPAIAVPDSVTDLVILGDTTSDPFTTRLALARASARYARPGRTVRVAWAPQGEDFDDPLRAAKGDEAAARAALERIAGIVAAAGPLEMPAVDAEKKSGAPAAVADRGDGAANARPTGAVADGGGNDGEPPPGGDDPKIGGGDDSAGLDLRLAFYPLTDLGNSERFRDRNRGRFIWCPALGWLWWDGRRWSRDGAEDKVKMAEHDTVRAIQREARAVEQEAATLVPLLQAPKDISDADKRSAKKTASDRKKRSGDLGKLGIALRMWGRKSEQANKLAAIGKRAAPYLAVAPEQLDADPFKFNVASGTLVFRKAAEADYVTFKAHDPADLITKCSRVAFDPKAICPTFDKFLAEVQPKAEMRRFLMQWQGLSLTGDVSEQKLCLFWGSGKNGKSTLIDVCAHIAGDYSETVPIETFLNEGRSRNAGQATPDLAILPGVRHLRTSEPEKGAKLAEALIKLATGGEPILARHLNQDYFKFYPQFKLTISGNHEPSIVGTDEGIWRRLKKVPWPVTVADDKIDPHLSDKLRGEASGILNRLLDGLRDWLDHGLVWPEDVIQATADYRRDSDPCGRFIGECVTDSSGDRVRSSDMHALFCAWAKASAAREWSQKGLAAALKQHGFKAMHSNGMWWLGVKLTKSADDFLDFEGKARRGESENVKDDRMNDEVAF
jgi:P4 family phage/plasmid primase-like protien